MCCQSYVHVHIFAQSAYKYTKRSCIMNLIHLPIWKKMALDFLIEALIRVFECISVCCTVYVFIWEFFFFFLNFVILVKVLLRLLISTTAQFLLFHSFDILTKWTCETDAWVNNKQWISTTTTVNDEVNEWKIKKKFRVKSEMVRQRWMLACMGLEIELCSCGCRHIHLGTHKLKSWFTHACCTCIWFHIVQIFWIKSVFF